MHLRIIFLVEGEVLNCLHDIPLAQVNHGLNIVDQALMLYQSRILNSLLDLDRILANLSA